MTKKYAAVYSDGSCTGAFSCLEAAESVMRGLGGSGVIETILHDGKVADVIYHPRKPLTNPSDVV